MTPDMLKVSWLTRESQFLAFANGPLLDFWKMHDEAEFTGVDNIPIRYVKICSAQHDKAIVIARRLNFDYKVCYELYN